MKNYKSILIIAGTLLSASGPDDELELRVDPRNAAIVHKVGGSRALIRTGNGYFTGRVHSISEEQDGTGIVQVKEVLPFDCPRWITLAEIDRDEPGNAHKYNCLSPADSIIGRHGGYEAFIYPCVDGSWQYRGGYRSHLNLSQQEGGFADRRAAIEDAELWLIHKRQVAVVKAINRSARLG